MYEVERAERARAASPMMPSLPDPVTVVDGLTDRNHNNSIKTILEQAEADLTACKTILEQAEASLTISQDNRPQCVVTDDRVSMVGEIVKRHKIGIMKSKICPDSDKENKDTLSAEADLAACQTILHQAEASLTIPQDNRAECVETDDRVREVGEILKRNKIRTLRHKDDLDNAKENKDTLSSEADLAACRTIPHQAGVTLTAHADDPGESVPSGISVPSVREVTEIINRHHTRVLGGRDILNMDEEERDRLSEEVRDALMKDLDAMGREARDAGWWDSVAEVLEEVDFRYGICLLYHDIWLCHSPSSNNCVRSSGSNCTNLQRRVMDYYYPTLSQRHCGWTSNLD